MNREIFPPAYSYNHIIRIILLFTIIVSVFAPACSADRSEFRPVLQARDISDRGYEPAVIELLDNARSSIVISMYIIQVQETGPVRLLVKDLEEALARGVSVDIYLNTRFQEGRPLDLEHKGVFTELRSKGARIFFVTPSIRMHDKLIIADNRYMVIGSANWSVASLKANYESVILLDSPELAQDMLVRLRQHTLKGNEPDKPKKPRKVIRPVILKEGAVVELDRALMDERSLFPRMLTEQDARSMDAYLLLKAYAYEQGAAEYFLSLEQLAVDLGMPPVWTDTALRRQAIKVLTKLEKKYKLIDVDFRHGKDAWIKLIGHPGGVFDIDGKFLDPGSLTKQSQAGTFALLIKAILSDEGASISSFTQAQLSKRFGIDRNTLSCGLKEISDSPEERIP